MLGDTMLLTGFDEDNYNAQAIQFALSVTDLSMHVRKRTWLLSTLDARWV